MAMEYRRRRWRRRTLPEEMVEEIILRLPPKQVGRLRLLSKAWNSRLSSPEFVKSHSKFHMNRRRDSGGSDDILIFYSGTYSTYSEPLFTLPAGGGDADLVSSPLFDDCDLFCASAEASCHGFVVVEFEDEFNVGKDNCKKTFLFNPTTKNAVEIPVFKSLGLGKHVLGLGYDSSTDNYKLVRLSSSKAYDETFVDVYCFKSKAWKHLGNSPYHVHGFNPGLFLNGCLHWACRVEDDDEYLIIVAFDLAKEEFKVVPSPRIYSDDDSSSEDSSESPDDDSEECSDDSFEECSDEDSDKFLKKIMMEDFKGFDSDGEVAVYRGGCLAVVTNPLGRNHIEIWTMEEYGVQESWKKRVIENDYGVTDDGDVHHEGSGMFQFVCPSGKNHLIFRRFSSDEDVLPFLRYNESTRGWKDVVVPDWMDDIAMAPNVRVVTFKECLLSPSLL